MRKHGTAKFFLLLTVCIFCIFPPACSHQAVPKIHYYKKNGVQWYTSEIYSYPDGRKKLAQIDTYKKEKFS
jgi:hypothetical protein